MKTPFTYIEHGTMPIRKEDRESFIGRRPQMDCLYHAITQEEPEHIAIYGMPHIGKSSLLIRLEEMLTQPGVRTENGQQIAAARCSLKAQPYTEVIQMVLKELDRAVKNFFSRTERKALFAVGPESSSPEGITQKLREILRLLTQRQIRTVVFLDEFERVGGIQPKYTRDSDPAGSPDPSTQKVGAWSFAEYRLFFELLIDRTLSFACVTASRPAITNLLPLISPKAMNPFTPFLLKGFDDAEMAEWFALLQQYGFTAPLESAMTQNILRCCGRSPFLLTLLSSVLLNEENQGLQFPELLRTVQQQVYQHFDDVIIYMQFEESQRRRSLSHVVKCHFGTEGDYQDILQHCIDNGYIELEEKGSPFTYPKRRVSLPAEWNPDGSAEEKMTFTTVSSLCVDYLYANYISRVFDSRDLLTRVVYALRDITQIELTKELGEDWNRRLVTERLYFRNHGCNKGLLYDSDTGVYEAVDLVNSEPDGRIQMRSPCDFTLNKMNAPVNGSTPSLDCLNLNDHFWILSNYWDSFRKYFLPGFASKNQLKQTIKTIKVYRDNACHFSRVETTPPPIAQCQKLLQCIYSYLVTDFS